MISLIDCAGQAAAVSPQRSSVIGRNDCIGGSGMLMCHISVAPLTWCGLPPGSAGSQLLDASQIQQWSPTGNGTESRLAQSPSKIDENCPSCSFSDHSSKGQSPAESGSLPEICNPMPDALSEESLLLAARRVYQAALRTFLKSVQKRTVVYSNDCFVQGVQHHHGSQLLAAVMDRWPSFSRSGSRKRSRFHQCLKEWWQFTPARTQQTKLAPVCCSTPHPSTHHHMAAFILVLLVTNIRPSRQSFWR